MTIIKNYGIKFGVTVRKTIIIVTNTRYILNIHKLMDINKIKDNKISPINRGITTFLLK